MAAWLKQHRTVFYLFSAMVLSALFSLPYLCRDFLALEHDTLFHLSRIEGLAESISRGDFFPSIYPYKNGGFGYASPLFYCDVFLIPWAMLYRFGMAISTVYRLLVITVTFVSAWAVLRLCDAVSDDPLSSLVLCAAFLFSNYRITDVYVRGALGEVIGFVFLSILLRGLFRLFEQRNESAAYEVMAGISGLLLSHNLSALFGFFLILVFFLCYVFTVPARITRSLFKALVLSFLLTAWFTLPMIEQLRSQPLVLNYYANSSDLSSYALPLWKYFANTTVFGYGSNDLPRDMQMTVNPGIVLSLLPLFWLLFYRKSQHRRFVSACFVLGYVTLILPWDGFPWDRMRLFSILQFPWRLFTLSILTLCVPGVLAVSFLSKNRPLIAVILLCIVAGEGLYHVAPAMERTFGIDSSTSYEMLTDGTVIDPYYSATYMRVELAGGEYLPVGSPDFRTFAYGVHDSAGSLLSASTVKDGTSLTVRVAEIPSDGLVEAPLTWYPGYTAFDESGKQLEVFSSSRKLAACITSSGEVRFEYAGTVVQRFARLLSLISFLVIMLIFVWKLFFQRFWHKGK